MQFILAGTKVEEMLQVHHYLQRNSTIIARQDIIEGIKQEYEKEEKVFNE